jgi:hypothetical protein
MALLGTVVLLFQALLLAHGGLTTLGANAFSMAIVGPWAGYGAYRLTRRLGAGVLPGAIGGVAQADLATNGTTAQRPRARSSAPRGVVRAAGPGRSPGRRRRAPPAARTARTRPPATTARTPTRTTAGSPGRSPR